MVANTLDANFIRSFARQRPHQIIAVLVRDVECINDGSEPIDDPTGWKAMGAAGTREGGALLSPSTPSGDTPVGFGGSNRRRFSEILSTSRGSSSSIREGKPALGALNTDLASGDYFTSKPLSAEPADITDDDEDSPIKSRDHFDFETPKQKKRLPRLKAFSTPTPTSHNRSSNSSSLVPPNASNKSFVSISSSSSNTSSISQSSTFAKLSEAEKKRAELQSRVWRARTQMPASVSLRVFRHPEECDVEVEAILRDMANST